MEEYHNEMTKSSSSELRDPGNVLLLVYITAIVCVLLLGMLWDVAGANGGEEEPGLRPENVRRGELLVSMENGQLQSAPLMSQQVSMEISGIEKNTPRGGTKKSTPQGGTKKSPGLFSRLPELVTMQTLKDKIFQQVSCK